MPPTLLAAAVLLALFPPAAGAAERRAPVTTQSWYVRTVEPNVLGAAGCETGTRLRTVRGGSGGAVLLVFGGLAPEGSGQWSFDLYRTGAPPARLPDVRNALAAYIEGYRRCGRPASARDGRSSAGTPLTLVVGTTTSRGYVTREAGIAFAHVVDELARVQQPPVTILAGNDIELGYVGPAAARAWVDGFHGATTRTLVNYGDLAGCPGDRMPVRGDCGTPQYPEWTVEDVWHVVGHPRTVNFPNIYVTSGVQARQWRNVSRYALQRHGRPLRFLGALSQIAACATHGCPRLARNSPATAWAQLWRLVGTDPRLATPHLASSDIGWTALPADAQVVER